MSYSLFIEKQVLKYLSKLNKKISKRIIEKIKLLKENPVPQVQHHKSITIIF